MEIRLRLLELVNPLGKIQGFRRRSRTPNYRRCYAKVHCPPRGY